MLRRFYERKYSEPSGNKYQQDHRKNQKTFIKIEDRFFLALGRGFDEQNLCRILTALFVVSADDLFGVHFKKFGIALQETLHEHRAWQFIKFIFFQELDHTRMDLDPRMDFFERNGFFIARFL